MVIEVDRIIRLIQEIGGIEAVGPDDDFYEAGFGSVKALNLLLELETLSDATIPDDIFVESRTPRALAQMIERLEKDQTS